MSDEKKMKSCKEVQDEIKKLKEDKKHFKDHNWYQLFGEEVGLKKGAELQLKADIEIVENLKLMFDKNPEKFMDKYYNKDGDLFVLEIIKVLDNGNNKKK